MSLNYTFFKKDGFVKYFKNTSWVSLERGIRIALGASVGVWVARYLGPTDYGYFSFAESFVGLFSAIATLGLDHLVVRDLLKDNSNEYTILGTAFFLKILGTFCLLGVLSHSNKFY